MSENKQTMTIAQSLGSYRDLGALRDKLQLLSSLTNLVTPSMQCGALPEGCAVAISAFMVNPNPNDGEVYSVGGGKLALGRVALDRIATSLNVSWDPQRSGRTDDGSDPHYCSFKAVGTLRQFDGSVQTIMGTKTMDLRDGSAQIAAMEAKRRESAKDPDAQLRELRANITQHAETKARLRAVRGIGIAHAYTAAQLARPFVAARLMFTGETDDPELKRIFAMKLADMMLGGSAALYGQSPVPPLALPSLHAPPPLLTAPRQPYEAVTPPQPTPASAQRGESAGERGAPPQNGAASPHPNGNGGAVFKFGRDTKGKALSDPSVSIDEVTWYANALERMVNDPEKARFRAHNELELAAARAEINRRNGVVEEDDHGPPDSAY